jgi:hypothetical protein
MAAPTARGGQPGARPPASVTTSCNHRVMNSDHHDLLPLENLIWRVAELAAAQLSPLGPVAVRVAYAARQFAVVAEGVDSERGFEITVELAEVVPGVQVDLCWELRDDRPIARLRVRIDLQFFCQWFDKFDVSRSSPRLTDVDNVGDAARTDPWGRWLEVLGDVLITDLARALGSRTSIKEDDGRALATLLPPDPRPAVQPHTVDPQSRTPYDRGDRSTDPPPVNDHEAEHCAQHFEPGDREGPAAEQETTNYRPPNRRSAGRR